MTKLLRMLLALFAVFSLSAALAACGDDDDEATTDTTEAEEAAEEPTDDGAEEEGEGEDENPCAEGGPGTFGPPAEGAPADDATPVAITATDYAFDGADALGTQGTYAMTLQNSGNELHEASIVRLAEGEVRTIEELVSSEEEPELTQVAFAGACPGVTTEAVTVEIDQPGRYVLACFIPVGTLPTAAEAPEGPPHAAQGMIQEFQVS
ncbi:MAG: hypothetical protein Q8K58_13110 [Acidimicrobiales bacterium]|nr:hypothetical protein [Acidimicrobiales bacterium]